VLVANSDGARVTSAALLSRTMATTSELAMSTLVAHGIPLRQVRVIVARFTVRPGARRAGPARSRTR
jgi:TetR/AcrR family tetracycline transcriptional repressor